MRTHLYKRFTYFSEFRAFDKRMVFGLCEKDTHNYTQYFVSNSNIKNP